MQSTQRPERHSASNDALRFSGFACPRLLSYLAATVHLLAAGRRLAETGEPIEIAHQRVPPYVRGWALRRFGDGVRGRPHEPRQQRFVFRMVVAIGALRPVRVRALPKHVAAHREADADDRIAGLE